MVVLALYSLELGLQFIVEVFHAAERGVECLQLVPGRQEQRFPCLWSLAAIDREVSHECSLLKIVVFIIKTFVLSVQVLFSNHMPTD